MIRQTYSENKNLDKRINYRGLTPSRLDTLTDTVFGIAITLMIFNIENPNSFTELVNFTKTLPAFLLSILFLFLIWREHVEHSKMYGITSFWEVTLNLVLLALIIFYVYPLRFLMLVNSNIFLKTKIDLEIKFEDIDNLMIYYGLMAFAVYFLFFLMNLVAKATQQASFNQFEKFHNKQERNRLIIMFGVPLFSVLVAVIVEQINHNLVPIISGFSYMLYCPLIIWWQIQYKNKEEAFPNSFE